MEVLALRKVPMFYSVSDPLLQKIHANSYRQFHKKNTMILFEEQVDSKLFIVLQGRVKETGISEDGREAIFSFYGEGDFFGEMAIFGDQIRTTNIVTCEDSYIMSLHHEYLQPILRECPTMFINLLKEMTQRLRRRDGHIKSLVFQDAAGKLAYTLLSFVDDLGDLNRGLVEINHLPAQKDIASMVGTSRETISRAMRLLVQKGHIRKKCGRLVIRDYANFRATFI
jgi:CRP/FNR family transcriptional regulator, cyclic AMP receptor protein